MELIASCLVLIIKLQIFTTLIYLLLYRYANKLSPVEYINRISLWFSAVQQLKSQFSRIHRSVIFYPKNTTFVVEVPAFNRKLHSKVEVNCTSCFLDTSDQSFGFCSSFFFSSSFCINTEITLTQECII